MSQPAAPTFPIGLSFDEARAVVARVAREQRLPVESLAPGRAHGRVLAQDVVASIALPPFDNSAMDGFALRHGDLSATDDTTLRLVGEQFAGRALGLEVGPGECVRITTGAPLPAGADAVAIRENVRIDGEHVVVPAGTVRSGAHVRQGGEDVRAGDRVLQAGCLLMPTRIALASSLGIDQLVVAQRPTVAVFTTGDELVEPGLPLQPGQIYNSNRELLMGLLRGDGLEPTAWPTLPDDPARLASTLHDAASSFDVVVTCGAVSAGEKDHIPALLQQHGRVHFWKVRMKPGMPLLFGQLGRAQLLGLPGNPVSVLATYLTLGRCLLDGLQGRAELRPRWHARMASAFDKRNARREFLRGRLLPGADGMLQVAPNPADGSHRLAAAAQSDALIVLPEGERTFAAGDMVEVLPY
jgi:molybdopterin molybdotransferase